MVEERKALDCAPKLPRTERRGGEGAEERGGGHVADRWPGLGGEKGVGVERSHERESATEEH